MKPLFGQVKVKAKVKADSTSTSTSTFPSTLLRVVLTLLLVFVGLMAGITFAPRLASWTGDGLRSPVSGPRSSISPVRAAQPDWGGGRLALSDRSTTGVIDSVEMTSGGDRSRTQTYSGSATGVLLRQKPDSDYALTLAVRSSGTSDRTVLFEMPSSDHFRKELLPGDGDAEPPAADIPLYPQSHCRMQVGHGTACFIGFYLTPDSVEVVRSFYVRALSRLGWKRVTGDGRTEDGGRETGRTGPRSPVSGHSVLETFEKRNEDRTVVVQLRKQDSVTTRISLVATTSGGSETEDGGRRTVFGPRSPVSSCNERK